MFSKSSPPPYHPHRVIGNVGECFANQKKLKKEKIKWIQMQELQ